MPIETIDFINMMGQIHIQTAKMTGLSQVKNV